MNMRTLLLWATLVIFLAAIFILGFWTGLTDPQIAGIRVATWRYIMMTALVPVIAIGLRDTLRLNRITKIVMQHQEFIKELRSWRDHHMQWGASEAKKLSVMMEQILKEIKKP